MEKYFYYNFISWLIFVIRHAGAFGLQAKIQELAEHVPKGHIPRTMTVHLRGELTRKVSSASKFPLVFLMVTRILFSVAD